MAMAVPKPGEQRLARTLSASTRIPVDPEPPDDSARIRALVELAQGGDTEAFGQLYDRYVTGIFRYIYVRVGNRQLAEDLTADTFLRALRSLHTFQWKGKDFAAWLTTIARNLMNDHYKSRRTRSEITTDALPDRPDPGRGPEADALASVPTTSCRLGRRLLSGGEKNSVTGSISDLELSVLQRSATGPEKTRNNRFHHLRPMHRYDPISEA